MNYETPEIIKELFNLDYHTEDDCMDFEAYGEFLNEEETAFLLHCWTGDNNYHGKEFRVFGRRASGCEYAIWLKNENTDLLNQPVVLLESEGQAYTVSTNYSDFLWYLIALEENINQSVLDYVKRNATTTKRDLEEIINEANEKYDFREYIWSKVVY